MGLLPVLVIDFTNQTDLVEHKKYNNNNKHDINVLNTQCTASYTVEYSITREIQHTHTIILNVGY